MKKARNRAEGQESLHAESIMYGAVNTSSYSSGFRGAVSLWGVLLLFLLLRIFLLTFLLWRQRKGLNIKACPVSQCYSVILTMLECVADLF